MKKSLYFLSIVCSILYSFSAYANVTNVTQGGAVYGTIQAAVNAANSGDTLLIGIGHYTENVEITEKSLRLEGGYLSGFTSRTNLAALTCIDAGGGGIGLLALSNATLVLEHLMITNGASFFGGGIFLSEGMTMTADYCHISHNRGLGGAGITVGWNSTLVLNDTEVTHNSANGGGGIYAVSNATVYLRGRTRIEHNYAGMEGGGVYMQGTLIGQGWHVNIQDNIAGNGGGGISAPGGEIVLTPGHVRNNAATNANARGGGILVYNGGRVSIRASGGVFGNTAYDGGGIYAEDAQIDLLAVVHGNSAGNCGGGICLVSNSFLTAESTFIGYASLTGANSADRGGGIYVDNSTISFSGNMYNNRALTSGGGIYASKSTVTVHNARIGGENELQPNTLGPDGNRGGGMYLYDTYASISNTVVASNLYETTSFVYGLGIYAGYGSDVTLSDSRIENHHIMPPVNGYGAGLYIYSDSSVTLDNSQVISNTAEYAGGGARVNFLATLNVVNNSVLANNVALNNNGGAVACALASAIVISNAFLHDNSAHGSGGALFIEESDLVLDDALFRHNTAGQYGGAITVDEGTAHLSGSPQFSENIARAGGAVAASRSAFSLSASKDMPLLFSRNMSTGTDSDDGGGAILLYNCPAAILYNTRFTDNVSSNHGGALLMQRSSATIAGDFTEWPFGIPPVLFSNNTAMAGLGGAIRLSHGSDARMSDAMIVNNRALIAGGISMSASTVDVVNLVVYNNSAGIRMADNSSVRARHCTIINNSGQGIAGDGDISVSNCIVRGQFTNVEAGSDVHYSNIEGGYTGTGNIDEAPLFVNAVGYNFALRANSPCVDSGANVGVTWDCIGAPRPMNAGYDMGAYEMNPAPLQWVVPTLLDFGDVLIGESASQSILVENRGHSALNGTVFNIPFPTFTVVPNTYSIAPLDNTNLIVTFTPAVEFEWTQTVSFASNGGTQDVVFIGTGIPEPTGLVFGVVLLGFMMRMRAPRV